MVSSGVCCNSLISALEWLYSTPTDTRRLYVYVYFLFVCVSRRERQCQTTCHLPWAVGVRCPPLLVAPGRWLSPSMVNGLRTKRILRINPPFSLSLQAFGGSGVGLRTKRVLRINPMDEGSGIAMASTLPAIGTRHWTLYVDSVRPWVILESVGRRDAFPTREPGSLSLHKSSGNEGARCPQVNTSPDGRDAREYESRCVHAGAGSCFWVAVQAQLNKGARRCRWTPD